jgi:hypothetical protein
MPSLQSSKSSIRASSGVSGDTQTKIKNSATHLLFLHVTEDLCLQLFERWSLAAEHPTRQERPSLFSPPLPKGIKLVLFNGAGHRISSQPFSFEIKQHFGPLSDKPFLR